MLVLICYVAYLSGEKALFTKKEYLVVKSQ